MKPATLKSIKEELVLLSPDALSNMLQRLARFKKENKELLTYLLFEQQDEEAYVQEVCLEMDEMFAEANVKSPYILKKNLRKIIRTMLRYIRYSEVDETEVRLRLHFCKLMYGKGFQHSKSTQIRNMYESQRTYAERTISKLHEDLQYEHLKTLRTMV